MGISTNFKTPKDMALTSIEWFVMLAVLALVLRALFHLFGAEGGSDGFVNWLYGTSDVLLQPVRGVYPSAAAEGRYAVDFVALFGAVGYMVVGVVAGGVAERWAPKRK